MSRTYRRKNGDQWWRKPLTYTYYNKNNYNNNPTSEELIEYKKYLISLYEKRDYNNLSIVKKRSVKWNGNLLRRSCKKEQLAKFKKINDFNDADYDNTKELSVKSLVCIYD